MSTNKKQRHNIARAFGRVLKQARRKVGLSQVDLAANAEINKTYPSLLERGLRTPTLGVFIALAKHCKIEPQQLLTQTLAEMERV